VPVVLVGTSVRGRQVRDGVLADVAATLLSCAGEPNLPGQTGASLLEAATIDGRK
jgi:bisphosphoglycerate-independent phosphoglycerate mutase (AlkP superfamily)